MLIKDVFEGERRMQTETKMIKHLKMLKKYERIERPLFDNFLSFGSARFCFMKRAYDMMTEN